jgi:FkbM family methyltransferase
MKTSTLIRTRKFQGKVYRRICRVLPVQVNIIGKMDIFLDSKYAISHFAEIFASRTYYPALELLKHPPRCVLDLGAHEGFFTLMVESHMRQRFPSARVQYELYEANPKLIKKAKRNIRMAGLEECTNIHNGAIGKRSGTIEFNICENLGFSSITPINGVVKTIKTEYLDVEANLLKSGQPTPELIKIDVEGSEIDFFENYPELLRSSCVIAVEFHRHAATHEKWRDLVKAAGLSLHEVTAETGLTINEILVNKDNLQLHNARAEG